MKLVIGVDPHKQTHTAAAVDRAVAANPAGHAELLAWARELGGELVWALEDVRGVSRELERFPVARGERVLRVQPKLMAGARRCPRSFGKSDSIDGIAIARAALAHGDLPVAIEDEAARAMRLLVDHRETLVRQQRSSGPLRWLLHAIDPELRVPAGALDRKVWLDRLARRLARSPQR